jgi:hypothetical protein
MEKHISHSNFDFMHAQLGRMYALAGDVCNAMLHFHTALSISPHYPPAVMGLAALDAKPKDEDEQTNGDGDDDDDDRGAQRRNGGGARLNLDDANSMES